MVPHHALKVSRPTPAGQDVCTFQVVVGGFAGMLTNGAPMTPVAAAMAPTPAALNSSRRLIAGLDSGLRFRAIDLLPKFVFWPCGPERGRGLISGSTPPSGHC